MAIEEQPKPPYPSEGMFKHCQEAAKLLMHSVKQLGKMHVALSWDTIDEKWVYVINAVVDPPIGVEVEPDRILLGQIAVIIPPEDTHRYIPEGAEYSGVLEKPYDEPSQAN